MIRNVATNCITYVSIVSYPITMINIGCTWSLFWEIDRYFKSCISKTLMYIVTYIEEALKTCCMHRPIELFFILQLLDRILQVLNLFFPFQLKHDRIEI